MTRFACLAALLLHSVMVPAQQLSSVPGQGRSMVVSKFGIVSTPQFLASQAGAHILEQGGNAIDAAIAANAVMGVVQPYVNGIGGDLFMVYYEAKTGKVYGLNSSGWTPRHSPSITSKPKASRKSIPSASRASTCRARLPDGMPCVRASVDCPLANCSPRPFTTRRMDFRWQNAMRVTGSPKG
jgi:hypothetical protein